MISVLKNFHDIPKVLTSEKVKTAYSVFLKSFKEDNSSKIPDFLLQLSRSRELKIRLSEIYQNKCAYCEQIATLDIENYRPKSQYPLLVIEWSNVIPVCRDCNLNRKNIFSSDLKTVDHTVTIQDLADLKNFTGINKKLKEERPLLLHPEIDTPENHLHFDYQGNIIGRTERGRFTINAYNLNRTALVQKRNQIIESLIKEIKELTDDYFYIEQNFTSIDIPKDFKRFFSKIYNYNSKYEFTRLHQSIWEDELFLKTTFYSDNDKDDLIRGQLSLWKNKYLSTLQGKKNYTHPSLKSINLKNIEGIRSINLSNLPPSKWIFFTGENGYGKSTILKAIATGLTGDNRYDNEARTTIQVFEKEITEVDNNNLIINEYTWQSDSFKPFQNIAAYGANRTTLSKKFNKDDNVLDNIFGVNNELLNIESYLTSIYHRPNLKSKFLMITETLRSIIPNLAKIEIDESKDIPEIKYYEFIDSENTTFEEVSFNQLATGLKSVIAMVGDILCRFIINKEITDSKDIEGIVIIDEIDIHLHPKWQRSLPTFLSKAFPKIQFIVSTHSAIPLLGAPENSIFLKVTRDISSGVQIERLIEIEENIKNMMPNLIYTSELFDLGSITAISNKSKKDVYTQDSLNEVREFKELKKKFRFKDSSDTEFINKIKSKLDK